MKKVILTSIIFTSLLIGCQPTPPPQVEKTDGLSDEDKKHIYAISKNYVEGWLENDSSRILNLFLDSAKIIPSGMAPKMGKQEIKDFWFPNDSSKTEIHRYDINILELSGDTQFAYTFEKDHLSYSYTKGDFQMTKESNAYAATVYIKPEGQDWKILTRIWTDLK